MSPGRHLLFRLLHLPPHLFLRFAPVVQRFANAYLFFLFAFNPFFAVSFVFHHSFRLRDGKKRRRAGSLASPASAICVVIEAIVFISRGFSNRPTRSATTRPLCRSMLPYAPVAVLGGLRLSPPTPKGVTLKALASSCAKGGVSPR